MNIICAYPVNLDAVYDLEEERMSRFIQVANPLDIKSGLKGSIRSREDLISSLLYCIKEGSGAEILVESQTLAEEIKSNFSWRFRLGGNAGIMANLLTDLGAQTILNAPALEPRLAELLRPGVGVPFAGQLLSPCRAAEKLKIDPEVVHFVFQFKENDHILSPQGMIAAAKDNRFIATYDPVNTRLVSSSDFDSYCLDNILDIDGALVSGFHLAPLDQYKEIFSSKIEQIGSWKKANVRLYVHVEMGSFQSQEITRHFLGILGQISPDSLGLNEDELEGATADYSKSGPSLAASYPSSSPSSLSSSSSSPSSLSSSSSSSSSSSYSSSGEQKNSLWQERMQKAAWLRERLGLFRVAVHTRDYILSAMQEGRLSAEDEIASLQKGTDAAAALAATGSATGAPPDEVNPKGLEAKKEFCRQGARPVGRGAFHQKDGVIVSLMPSLLAREPKITVGLGDTATAAVFYQELQAIKRDLI